ncbi:MAG TPA: NUDIX domain-containing protein [Actinomycetes bacterium]|nr:NUDIX domain-containing protein [Actinomycetes bacterium]
MSLALSARELLTRWSPPSDRQRELRDEFVQQIDRDTSSWSRNCRPDHLTASVIVLDQTQTHVLLGLHAKVGLWLQFGGHIEADDASVQSAAERELVEESGIGELSLAGAEPLQLDRHPAPCGARHHLDIQFAAYVDHDVATKLSQESLALRWFPVDALPDETDAALRSLVAAATTQPAR